MKKFLITILLFSSLCAHAQIRYVLNENLIKSTFDSIQIYKNKNEKLVLANVIHHRKNENDFLFCNYEKPKDNLHAKLLYAILNYNDSYKLIKEKEFLTGVVIRNNKLKDTIFSSVTEYIYRKNTISKNYYSSENKLQNKVFQINDEKGRKKEIINIFYSNNDIVVNDIKKYDWLLNGNGYNYESEQFTFPRQKFVGTYLLDEQGNILSMKGNLQIEGEKEAEIVDLYNLPKQQKELDEKGNVVKIFEIKDGNKKLIEERKFFYTHK